MSLIWTLAKKEFLLLLRDRLALILLLALPLLFILILGLLLGEGFGQPSDDKLRVSIVMVNDKNGASFDQRPWSEIVLDDLKQTAGIRVEIIGSAEEARQLIADHKRAAMLIFHENFSPQMNRCSFTSDGINPFHREGVYLEYVGATLLKDSTQLGAASLIEQVVQMTMLRVILPWMIGQAFERLSEPQFIALLGEEVKLPAPMSQDEMRQFLALYHDLEKKPLALTDFDRLAKFKKTLDALPKKANLACNAACGLPSWTINRNQRISLNETLEIAAESSAKQQPNLSASTQAELYRKKVGSGVQRALGKQFENYNLSGKTWADLVKSTGEQGKTAESYPYVNRDGAGFLKRGAYRYQVLVPSYTVMFAFFLALIVGWVFVAERRQGTLKRLRAAPVTRGHIILGKMLPCYVLSVCQGLFLLGMGRLLFGMRWGPDNWPWWEQTAFILAVVLSTSLAVMGLAMLVAAVARSEMQVALFGAVVVLVLALIGGCVLPREMMPEQTQQISLITPHGWALDAYRELLNADPTFQPNLAIVGRSCAVLAAFGLVFLGGAWGLLRLD
jgi:ABC-2 type transport system permease protein